jgi:uncharacterized protein (DUF488 family)
MESVPIYTIGFTQKTAASFFDLLRTNRIERLVDIRANNTSQLSGFTKRDDLAFFTRELVGAEYVHLEWLAPTPEIRATLKQRDQGWPEYERRFLSRLHSPDIASRLNRRFFTERTTCLLCSEPTADRCHRRLVAEFMQQLWPEVHLVHL